MELEPTPDQRASVVSSAVEKKNAISVLAVSGPSEPCTAFAPQVVFDDLDLAIDGHQFASVIAQALIMQPRILLMDEPFGALDPATRESLQRSIVSAWCRVSFTSVIIPVGINHVIRGWPWVTIGIIAMCTVVQIYSDAWAPSPEAVQEMIEHRIRDLPAGADEAQEGRIAQDLERIANRIPSVRLGYRSGSGASYRLVTSAFVHAGWLHLIGNMLFLWLVGAALEDRWGRTRFAAFYAAGAIVSALCFAALHIGQEVTLVGASGAISALMGAFLVCFARTQIHFVYWLGRGIGRFDAAAYVALPLWLAEQVLYAWLESDRGESGTAFSAHIGGFVFGLAAIGALTLFARTRERAAATGPQPSAPRPSARPPDRPIEPPKRPPEPPRPDPPADPAGGPRFLT